MSRDSFIMNFEHDEGYGVVIRLFWNEEEQFWTCGCTSDFEEAAQKGELWLMPLKKGFGRTPWEAIEDLARKKVREA